MFYNTFHYRVLLHQFGYYKYDTYLYSFYFNIQHDLKTHYIINNVIDLFL